MTRFAAVLRRVESRLTLPHPVRSRVLEEMAADLEDLYLAYRARGVDDEEALRRAERALGASPEAVEALIELHRPLYARLLGRFSAGARGRTERAALSAVGLLAVAIGTASLARQGILAEPSPFVWPLLATAAVAVALALSVSFRLFVKQDHAVTRLRSGLAPLALLAAVSALVGAFGSLWEIYATAADIARAGAGWLDILLPRVRRASEVGALGITVSLGTLLAWFHLRQRALAIERGEAELAERVEGGGGESAAPDGTRNRSLP